MVSSKRDIEADGVDIQGAGLDVFMSLSADTMRLWSEAVAEVITDDSVDVSAPITSFSESLGHLVVSELVESDESDDARPKRDRRSSILDIISSMLPATARVGLFLVRSLKAIGPAVLWGLVLAGGFRIVRSAIRKRMIVDGVERDVSIDDLLLPSGIDLSGTSLVESSDALSDVVVGPLRGVVPRRRTVMRASVGELEGAEVLYERLVGVKASGGALTSGYYRSSGEVHGGWDLRIAKGTSLRWPFDEEGVVVRASTHSQGGRQLHIRTATHEWGFAHLDNNAVLDVGSKVRRGDVFAVSGNSGRQDNGQPMPAHLHVNVMRLSNLGKEYTSDKARRLGHERIEGAMQAEGVSFGEGIDISSYRIMDDKTVLGGVSGDVRFGSALSARTNNPFSIMRSGSGEPWEGEVGLEQLSQGRRMVKFSDPVYSARAAARTLLRYQMDYDISRTGKQSVMLRDLARKYVYGNLGNVPTYAGDDADAWAETVSDVSGLPLDRAIDLRDEDVLSALLQGIARMESGTQLGRATARRGAQMAYSSSYRSGWNTQGGELFADNMQKF